MSTGATGLNPQLVSDLADLDELLAEAAQRAETVLGKLNYERELPGRWLLAGALDDAMVYLQKAMEEVIECRGRLHSADTQEDVALLRAIA